MLARNPYRRVPPSPKGRRKGACRFESEKEWGVVDGNLAERGTCWTKTQKEGLLGINPEGRGPPRLKPRRKAFWVESQSKGILMSQKAEGPVLTVPNPWR